MSYVYVSPNLLAAAIAALFSALGQAYQSLSAQTAAFGEQFQLTLTGGNELLSRPLIGDGTNVCRWEGKSSTRTPPTPCGGEAGSA